MRRALAVLALVLAAACGTTPTMPPVSVVLALSSFSPTVLSTTGGGTFTILGAGFGSDTVVTFGSVVITGVTVSPTTLTLTAPLHAAGVGSFTVTSAGKSVTGSVIFTAPSGLNLAPAITNLRTVGSRSGQPSLFVDLNEEVQILATVSNVETSATLSYAWTVGAGTVTGTGASATWKLPTNLPNTPAPVAAALTVTETFTESGVQHRNVATASVLANVHDSQTEVLNKGFQFLDRFSQSQYTPAEVLVDFDQTSGGYAGELNDVVNNRTTFLELPGYTIQRLPPVTFNFGGECPNQAFGDNRRERGDACAAFDVHWFVRYKINIYRQDGTLLVPAGSLEDSLGRDFVTAALRGGEWKLVGSGYLPARDPIVTLPNGTVKVMPELTRLGLRLGAIKKRRP